MMKITFCRDSEQDDWTVYLDGKEVCQVDGEDTDVGTADLEPLWEALGITLTFEEP